MPARASAAAESRRAGAGTRIARRRPNRSGPTSTPRQPDNDTRERPPSRRRLEEFAMTAQQYVVMAAGFLGLCTIGLLTHGGALTISNHGAGALTGARAMVHAELERWESAVPAGRRQD